MKYSASNLLTKNAILQSFTSLLSKKALDDITIGEITENVGLSRKTFYYHFVDINDLILWLFRQQIKSALETSDAEQNRQVGLTMYLQEIEKRKTLFAAIFNSKYSKVLRNGFMDITQQSLAQVMHNVPKVSDIDNEVLYRMFAIAFVSVVENWVCGRIDLTVEEFTDYINRLIAIVFLGIDQLNTGLIDGDFDLAGLEDMLGKLDYPVID